MTTLSRRHLITSAAALFALGASRARAAEVLVIAAVNNSGGSAVAARLLAEIYRRAGLQLQIEVLPAVRAGLMASAGQTDGELIRIQNYGQGHPQLLRVDPAFYRVSVRAYSLADHFAHVRTRDDLQHYSLGAIRGMSYVSELVEKHPALTLTQNPTQMFRMLQAGRLDLVLSSTVAARSSIERLQIRDVVASPELARFELYHYLHMRRKALLPRLVDIIRRLKASGELERLIVQYEAAVEGVDTD